MTEQQSSFAILWDVENVTPKAKSLFIESLIDYGESHGKFAFASAYGDWTRGAIRNLADVLAEYKFNLVHIPSTRKNSSDISLITQATEMIFQYPHIDTYIILTGDIDFRPLLLMLRKHGKKIFIICDSQNVAEDLLTIADDYIDYRNLIVNYENYSFQSGNSSSEIDKELAFKLIVEAIKRMENENKIPTLGSVKVKMKLLNESFDEKVLGYSQWKDFVLEAMEEGYIRMFQEGKHVRLTLEKEDDQNKMPSIIKYLLRVLKQLSTKNNIWINFATINNKLLEQGIKIEDFGYKRLKELVLDAEKRGLVETKNDRNIWYAKLV